MILFAAFHIVVAAHAFPVATFRH